MSQKRTGLIILFIIVLSQILFLFQSCSDSHFSFVDTETRLSSVEGFKGLILINNDDPYTKDKTVTLSLFEGLVGVTEMKISHNEDCSDGQWEPYSETKPWTLSRANQQVSVYVKYRDRIDSESSCYGDDIVHDSLPPKVIFQEVQSQFIASNSYQTRFKASDSGSGLLETQCFREGARKENCTTTYDASSLAEGAHSVSVEAKDRAGNKKTYVYHFSVDTSKPQISFTRKPAERSNKNQNIEFRWVARDSFSGISRVECKMDDEAYAPCSQSQSYSTLSDGNHSFSIKATDNLGHVLEKAYAFSIDTQAPDCVLEEKPGPFIRSASAVFRFRSEAGASFFCKKSEDGGSASFKTCPSPQRYRGLSHNSSHTFTLQCRDSLGNVAEVSHSWRVDLTAPEVTITKTPSTLFSNQEEESFRVVVEDRESGISHKVCTLDGQACPNSITQGLATTISVEEGEHRLIVKATNEAGGVTTEIFDWLNDRTPPEITFTQKPPKTVTGGVHDIHLAWTVRDLVGSTEVPMRGISEVQCVFQGQGQEVEFDCKLFREIPLTKQRDGVYHFTVKATDQAGNQASKTHRWVIDNYEQKTGAIHVTENLQSDILFVIDNSGSMKEEQRELADKIEGFLNIVDELDYHIAFTTTSHHKGGFLKIKHSRNRRGFVYVESDGTPYIGETPYVLKKNLEGLWTNHERTQVYSEAELLGDTILSAGTGGTSNEKGILASYKAIERRSEYPFNDFFRAEAPLSIILISDEDDDSNGLNHTPQEFKVFFESVWPGKRLKFHSIIKPDRSRCSKAAQVGHRYKKLSELTSGLVLPICAASYTDHLGHIGESIRNIHKTIPLECEPRDEDRDGDVKDDIRLPAALQGLEFSLQGRELKFTSDVPLGTHTIVYSCDRS